MKCVTLKLLDTSKAKSSKKDITYKGKEKGNEARSTGKPIISPVPPLLLYELLKEYYFILGKNKSVSLTGHGVHGFNVRKTFWQKAYSFLFFPPLFCWCLFFCSFFCQHCMKKHCVKVFVGSSFGMLPWILSQPDQKGEKSQWKYVTFRMWVVLHSH